MMFDQMFGKVEYDYGWCKPDTITLFDNVYEITCVASAYKNEVISEHQRTQYKIFKEKNDLILKSVEEVIRDYIEKYYSNYLENISNSIAPKELIFHQNGDAGIFFDCEWDVESGIVVTIYPQISICHPDLFL